MTTLDRWGGGWLPEAARDIVPVSERSPLHEADLVALREGRADDPRPDPKVTYLVDDIPFGEFDPDGCWWIVQETKGWHSAPGMKTARSSRPFGSGDWRSSSWRKSRVVTLKGTCVTPSLGARLSALDRLAGLCSDGGRLHELRVTDQIGRVRTIDVELEGEPDVTVRHETRFDWQVQLAAPDPRKHGIWQDPFISPHLLDAYQGSGGSAGLDFASGSGLSFGNGGLDFGRSPTPGAAEFESGYAMVANYGTAPAYPLIKVTGPILVPEVVDVESGLSIRLTWDVAGGETVHINCDDHAARGYRGHAVWSSTRGNLRALLTTPREWPSVQPGTVGRWRVRPGGLAIGNTSAEVMVSLRSAWH